MSVSSSDSLFLSWLPMEYSILFSIIAFTFFIGSSMKLVFGTYSPVKVMNDYKQKKEMSEKYHKMLTNRENLVYHISWAKSRGDVTEANRMIPELVQLDKEIDMMEAICTTVFGQKKQQPNKQQQQQYVIKSVDYHGL